MPFINSSSILHPLDPTVVTLQMCRHSPLHHHHTFHNPHLHGGGIGDEVLQLSASLLQEASLEEFGLIVLIKDILMDLKSVGTVLNDPLPISITIPPPHTLPRCSCLLSYLPEALLPLEYGLLGHDIWDDLGLKATRKEVVGEVL